MGTYTTSDFRKGLKVQIDGVPYLMIEMNFRKPGKGNALYECKLRNLLRGTVTDKTYRAGQTLEGGRGGVWRGVARRAWGAGGVAGGGGRRRLAGSSPAGGPRCRRHTPPARRRCRRM